MDPVFEINKSQVKNLKGNPLEIEDIFQEYEKQTGESIFDLISRVRAAEPEDEDMDEDDISWNRAMKIAHKSGRRGRRVNNRLSRVFQNIYFRLPLS